jgi:hypothetical protein
MQFAQFTQQKKSGQSAIFASAAEKKSHKLFMKIKQYRPELKATKLH